MVPFKEGNIVRLYMKNFLTYTEIEVFPGANLNIIFGPNGSGKSSILCAICIVLGGKPEYTGRGKDVKDYIKDGEEKAVVEIELFHSMRNIVIKRSISRCGRTSFYLQQKETTQKVILDKVDKYGICINNLCQFLPQDRVSEFSKLNKIQLLHNTQRAIGEAELADQHQILCEKGKNVDGIVSQIMNLQKQLEVEVTKNNQLQDQVEAIHTEKSLDQLIKKLKGQHIFSSYISSRKELKDEMEPFTRRLLEKIKTLRNAIQPMKNQDENIQKNINNEKDSLKQLNYSVHQLELKGKKSDEQFLQLQTTIENEESDFQAYQRRCNQRIKEIDDLKHTIQAMESHVEAESDVNEEQLQKEVNLLTQQISELSVKSGSFNVQTNEYTYSLASETNNKNQIERSLRYLQDSKERRLKLLLQANDPFEKGKYKLVYQATGWIHENMNKFESAIHGPMFTIIDVKRMDYAKYLENTVSNNDLIAFICESKNDVNLLKKYADSYNWPINILHSESTQTNAFISKVPIERIRQIGFETYLQDCISAPPAVISYLCSIYNIQNIAIGNNADFSSVPDELSCFFIGEDRYDKSISRYDGASSISISQINNVFFMSLNSNEKDLEAAQNKMKIVSKRIEELQLLREELSTKERHLERELEMLRREKQQLQNKLQQRLQLESKIAERRKQLARREEEVIDISGEELKMKSKIKTIMGKMLELADMHVRTREELSTLILDSFNGALRLAAVIGEKQVLENEMDNLKSQISDTESEHTVQKEKELALKRVVKRLIDDLCCHLDCSILELKNNGSKVREELENDFKSREDIEQKLADTQARKECLLAPSANVLEDFNRREKQIKKLQDEIKTKSTDVENGQTNLEEAKSRWLPKIEDLTLQISQHFSSFMKRLGCAGVVTLDKGSNEADFTQYGLSIMVQFRDSEKLKELTAHQQSGGERSVSTALYLMALQTLTAVPFRCVDEINQGMDSNNESRMFKMMVDTTTAQTASQYFFLTPKLLPNLPSNKRVKYLNIVNGSHVPSYKLMRAETMLQNLRNRFQ